jgi:hypothetical protein
VVAFEDGDFDRRILEELRRLREHDAIRLLDLLFVAKDRHGDVVELEPGDPAAVAGAVPGAIVRELFGFVSDDEHGDDIRNGSALDRRGIWYLADAIPVGSSAVALIEHRWAVPLRDAIESASGHDLVDHWIHRDDLVGVRVDPG